jgi:hypothetical protein
VRFTVAYAGLGICPLRQDANPFVLEICGGADFGLIHATAEGLQDSRSTTRRLLQATAAFRSLVALNERWFIFASAGGLIAVSADSFVYRRITGSFDEIYRPAELSFTGEVGVTRRVW